MEKEAYLLELARYIVLNPVRARMVSRPDNWAWSSYRAIAGLAPAPAWLTTDWLLTAVGGRSRRIAQRQYREFVREGMEADAMPQGTDWHRVVMGGKAFVQKVRELVEGKKGLAEVPRGQRFLGRPPLAVLFKAAKSKVERDRRIREAFLTHSYRLNEIAAAVGLHYSSVSHVANAQEVRP